MSALSPLTLFLLFSRLSMIGFGGVMPWARRVLVDGKGVLSAQEFAETIAYAQMLPGPTICNLAIIVGHRQSGMAGASAALAGMVLGPSLVVLALGALYQRVGSIDLVKDAVRGMSVVAAAMVAAMAVSMARALPVAPVPILFALAMFAGIGLLHWPLLAVMAVLAALSVGVNAWKRKP